MKLVLVREGELVHAYMRCNVKDTGKLGNVMPLIFIIPKGYQKSELYAEVWNIPFSTAQYSSPQSSYVGLYETGNKGIIYNANRIGNIYLQASWFTDDEMPK